MPICIFASLSVPISGAAKWALHADCGQQLGRPALCVPSSPCACGNRWLGVQVGKLTASEVLWGYLKLP